MIEVVEAETSPHSVYEVPNVEGVGADIEQNVDCGQKKTNSPVRERGALLGLKAQNTLSNSDGLLELDKKKKLVWCSDSNIVLMEEDT